ncbi:unnamed protein product [Durusdinium trenchii]|uniref:Calmodulin n=1 Tax=Durusdinium trenchii TaxID=1381693 RepID=A0ABP0JXL7_9DINO
MKHRWTEEFLARDEKDLENRRGDLSPELGWWSFTATGPKKSERPVSSEVSARTRHRLERSDGWRGAMTAGEHSWRRTQELRSPGSDDSMNAPRDSTLHTHAALQTQAFVKSFMALTEKRVSAKEEVKVEKESSPERSPVVVHMPITQAKLAKTLERLSAPQNKRRGRTRQHVQDTRPEQSPEEIQLEIQKKKLKEHTIRRVIAGDGYQEYEGDSRLPADRQSTYAVDELHGRELTSAEQRSIMGVFREMVKSSGVAERAEQRGKEGRDASKPEEEMRGTSGAMISWSEVAKSLRGRLSNAHVQRLGVYFGLKALKGKIRYKLYEERIGLLVTATPEKRLRIAFGLLDVGGDGVLGRRDVFAALAATTFEDAGYSDPVTVVFNAPGAYGIHFADSDTPRLLVLEVVAESPAEKQGVRPGSRLAKINGMSVDKLTPHEVRALLMNPARPMSMTFHNRPQDLAASPKAPTAPSSHPQAQICRHNVGGAPPVAGRIITRVLQEDLQREVQEPPDSVSGIFDPRDLKRLLDALRTDFVTRRVKILVANGKNLKSPDQHFSNSNPYCQVEVEGKPRTRWQTKALPESLDPEWKEEREIADFAIGEKLKFTVRDKDFGTKEDDILGIAMLPSSRFQTSVFDGELPLYQDENMKQKTNSFLTVRVVLSGEGGIGLTDFEKVFHDGEPSFLQQLQEVMTGCVQKRNENLIHPVKLQVLFISATGLRNADAVAYSTCEIHNKAKYDRIRPKTVSESLDLVAIGSEKPQIVDYMPGEALRFAVYDGPKAENVELLGSCVFECTRFWPAGFEGTLQLTEEQTRREKKYNVILKIKVATPESALPHQFAAAAKEQSTNGNGGFERFEAEMLKLRERMPFLTEADFTWHYRVFEAFRDEDWLIQRSRLITSADKIFGIPVGHIAGRLFECVSPRHQPVGVLDWAQFLQRHRGPSWDAKQERIHLTFSLYDLDGDGMLSLADAISLSTEVVRLEKIYGEESAAIPVCEEMRWLYGFIANAADGGRDGGKLDLQVFKQLRPEPSIMQAMLERLDELATVERPRPSRPKIGSIDTSH